MKIEDYINQVVVKVEQTMDSMLQTEEPKMREIMDWVLKGKGKRIRPRFLIAASMLSNKTIDVSEYAAIIEIVHMASLVHDDIVDGADFRRGYESVYKKYGTKMAVYAGDYMIFAALSKNHIRPTLKHKRLYDVLSRVCAGELGQNAMLYDFGISDEQYIRNIRGKTAAMFSLSCELGATIAGLSKSSISKIKDFGDLFGVLFQLYDDLLDLGLGRKNIGKPLFQDIPNGIYSLPVIYSLRDDRTSQKVTEIISRSRDGVAGRDRDALLEAMVVSCAFKRCEAFAEHIAQEANELLDFFKRSEASEYFKNYLLELTRAIRDQLKNK